MVEQPAVNRRVTGSSPVSRAIFYEALPVGLIAPFRSRHLPANPRQHGFCAALTVPSYTSVLAQTTFLGEAALGMVSSHLL